ncbi:DUF1801 domain-containing protein [Candidatus Saccharibacteria bacterium]|nr:DUF1801 domain-containing protein [Candidatus Saccharibacteria bacterium]
MFKSYLQELSEEDQSALQELIDTVLGICPEAKEGVSYGLPAFIYKDKALVGFSVTKEYLSLYPYDPKLISMVKLNLEGFDLGKGVIRFSPEKPIPKEVLSLIVENRIASIDKKQLS